MLLLTSEELKELNKNLNAFEKFLQDQPDKALALGIRCLFSDWYENHIFYQKGSA